MKLKLHDDGRVFLAPMPDIDPFTITSSFDNIKQVIKLLSNNPCIKYLGIQSIPSENQDSQFKFLIKITKTGARALDMNPFGRYYVKLYLNNHLNPKIYYPFTYSSLTS